MGWVGKMGPRSERRVAQNLETPGLARIGFARTSVPPATPSVAEPDSEAQSRPARAPHSRLRILSFGSAASCGTTNPNLSCVRMGPWRPNFSQAPLWTLLMVSTPESSRSLLIQTTLRRAAADHRERGCNE